MTVAEREQRNSALHAMMINPQKRNFIAPLLCGTSTQSGGAIVRQGAGLFEVMSDPNEWRSAVKIALIIFVGFLILEPALAPDRKELAAKINHETLKAAAAIKGSTR